MMSNLKKNEINLIRKSWAAILEQVSMVDVGLVILQRLFCDYPESIDLFGDFDIKTNSYGPSMELLKTNEMVTSHALKVCEKMNVVLEHLEDPNKVVKMCAGIGIAHARHCVPPHYFDKMVGVLMAVITSVLKIENENSTAQAWNKLFVMLCTKAKEQMEGNKVSNNIS